MRVRWYWTCAASTGCRVRLFTPGSRGMAAWSCLRRGGCGGLKKSAANALRSGENAELKRLLAESMLDNAGLKDLLGKSWRPLRSHAIDASRRWNLRRLRPPPGAERSRISGPALG